MTGIADGADYAKIVSIAPGQLLTLYGTNLAPADAAQPPNGFPASFNGVTVMFNGIAAPILYTSPAQINLQVPYEIAGQDQVTMQVSSQSVTPPVAESYILAVVDEQPSVFLSAAPFSQPLLDSTMCNGQVATGLQPLALNADGTENSCANPAASGSTVTIFLNGLGTASGAQITGAVNPSTTPVGATAALNGWFGSSAPAITFFPVGILAGSIDSVAQLQMQVSSTTPIVNIFLQLQQASGPPSVVRGQGIVIWVRPDN